MDQYQFFKPTPLYKEFSILDLIEKEKNITQRIMSDHLGISVSMINDYIDEYEKKGYLKRKYLSAKSVEYCITKQGIERKKFLNIRFLDASQHIYNFAKNNITAFLSQTIKKGFKTIFLYGAGEVAEIMLQVIKNDFHIPFEVCAIIDDDLSKQGLTLVNTPIINIKDISLYSHDGIFISSYAHQDEIYSKLLASQYDITKIIRFFES